MIWEAPWWAPHGMCTARLCLLGCVCSARLPLPPPALVPSRGGRPESSLPPSGAGSLTLCPRCPAPALPLAASLQDSNKLTLDFGSLLGPIFYTWLLQLLLPVMLVSLVYEKERR